MIYGHRIKQIVIFLTCLLLAGCQSAVYMMPAPVAIKSGKHDPFATTPESERSSTIGVGYATNRLPVGAKQSRFYTRDFDQDIRMGVVDVQIGDGDQSWEEIHKLSIEGAEKHESLLSLQQTSEQGVLKEDDSLETLMPELEDLFSRFNRAIAESATKDITIYVHGANNNFSRTASQAAQYRHFTGRKVIVVLYSWPSAESILRYGTDVRHIMETVPTFVRFVKLLAKHTNARKINILAYSAGATLTTKSLAVLGRDSSEPDRESYRQSLRLGAIYFAAPDTDFDEFVEEYRSYQDIVDNVTMTMNQYDSVLGIAMAEHRSQNEGILNVTNQPRSGKSRLGKPDIDDLTEEQANWILEQTQTANFTVIDIDPTTIPGMAKGSHDYWYQSPWVSTDALLDLNFHASPEDRGLVSVETMRGARIWYFPADYETRVDAALDRLSEKFQ
ncbi:MAG: alpha/beta hydrolase [Arenicellales bacterium]